MQLLLLIRCYCFYDLAARGRCRGYVDGIPVTQTLKKYCNCENSPPGHHHHHLLLPCLPLC